VIEDSANGVRGGKAAGMQVVGYRNPHSGNQDLSPSDLIIDGFTPDSIEQVLALVSKGSTISA
jgi:beta-phosphoglucomutase-like phosphatase (HAD superfamily)